MEDVNLIEKLHEKREDKKIKDKKLLIVVLDYKKIRIGALLVTLLDAKLLVI